MKLSDYLMLLAEEPEILTLTYEQSHELCTDISKKQISDIPQECFGEIESLLIERLNSDAVEKHLVAPLERLLTSLREEQEK